MLKRIKTEKYEAQALAIAMVVIVVSSIIAMSIYYRTQKDTAMTLEERASAEALEISDLIIDKLTIYPIQDVIAKIAELQEEPFDYVEGTVPPLKESSDSTEITTLLAELGISESIRDLSICPLTETANEYELTIKQVDEDTYFEIKPGQVWSLPIKGFDLEEDSQLFLKFSVRGDSQVGFVITKIYAKEYQDGSEFADSYKQYSYEDIQNYCFSDTGSACNGQDKNLFDNSWIKYNINEDGNEIYIDMKETVDGYILDEVRVKAIAGTVGLNYRILPVESLEGLRMIQLRATANCSGIYRGKEVLIPEKKWHNTLFDYVVFNGEGSI